MGQSHLFDVPQSVDSPGLTAASKAISMVYMVSRLFLAIWLVVGSILHWKQRKWVERMEMLGISNPLLARAPQ